MENIINVEKATVYLSGREILHGINWQVKKGERCFILGANGAALAEHPVEIVGSKIRALFERN